MEGDLVLAVRESLRGGHAEGEVLVGEGEVEVSDVHLIARLLAEDDGAPGIRVAQPGAGLVDLVPGRRVGPLDELPSVGTSDASLQNASVSSDEWH
jgi:hypothetical protein